MRDLVNFHKTEKKKKKKKVWSTFFANSKSIASICSVGDATNGMECSMLLCLFSSTGLSNDGGG